jgi:PAS domain S-box-containing protein
MESSTELKEVQWLSHLYMQAPVAIGIYIGKEHVIELANPKMLELWGRSYNQVLNQPLFQALPEVSGQGFEEIFADVLNSGKPFVGNEMPATLKRNGQLQMAYFNIVYQPLLNENNEIYGIIQVATEVTDLIEERKKAERNEEMLKVAVDAAKMGTWHFDLKINQLTRSPQHDKIYGHDEMLPEWNQDVFMAHVIEEDKEFAKECFHRAIQSGVSDYSVRIHWKDKSIHWVHVKGKTYYDKKGEAISMSGIVVDITEQKIAEERERKLAMEHAGREEAERQSKILHDLFMDAPAPIVTLRGPDLIFELVNPMYQQIFPDKVLVGRSVWEALPELIGQPIEGIIKGVVSTGESFIGNEVPIMLDRKDNGKLETTYFNFVYQASRDVEGNIDGLLVFAFNVTDQIVARKKIESNEQKLTKLTKKLFASNEELRKVNKEREGNLKELAEKNKQLTKTNADLDNFIYTASHDLKAPISNLEGLLISYFAGKEIDGESKQMVDMMFYSIERFKNTIKDLTEITHVQRGENDDLQLLRVKALLEEVKFNIKDLIDKSKANFVLNIQVNELHFSRKNFRSILYNLISNAIKYASHERTPEIYISTSVEREYTVLTVRDNGLGISPNYKEKIFGMFKRLHDHVEGSGVGLYIVKRIVDNAGGKIELESEVNVGSTFKIYLKNSGL